MGNRRDFLRKSIGLAGLAAAGPHVWVRQAMAKGPGPSGVVDKVFVMVQLQGGNDGLNTVVPYSQGAYYDARATIGIPQSSVLPIGNGLGLHPSLAPLMPYFESQRLAVVNGVGYAQPNRSHFRSTDIWHTAEPIAIEDTGWLGRYADLHLGDAGELAAVAVGGSAPKSFAAEAVVLPAIANLASYQFLTDPRYTGDRQNQVTAFLGANDRPNAAGDEKAIAGTSRSAYTGSAELQAKASGYTPAATYPDSRLGADLQFAAQIILSGVGTRIVHVRIGGFDTHANQPAEQAGLLADVATSLAAFQSDVDSHGIGDKVAVMTYSEFGRRVDENGSNGTDHGTSAPLFVLGHGVAGGLHGEYPSLTDLDGNGDLLHTVDFREVYADVLERWLGVGSSEILGGSYTPVGLFRS
jgi:uncharacterized protein (DUF1501 family)